LVACRGFAVQIEGFVAGCLVKANQTALRHDQSNGQQRKGSELAHPARLILTIAAFLGCAGPALAEPGQTPEPSDALSTLLPHEPGKALCYVSTGEPATYPLEDIPKPKVPRFVTVKRVLFELKSSKFDDDDATDPPTRGEHYYAYRMVAEVVGTEAKLISAGDCGSGSPSVFGCGTDCDGGTMAFEPVPGSDALMMRVSELSRRFRMSWGCCGGSVEGGTVEVLRYDPATPALRMARADPKVCKPMDKVFKAPE
jgi:hypothetical protein